MKTILYSTHHIYSVLLSLPIIIFSSVPSPAVVSTYSVDSFLSAVSAAAVARSPLSRTASTNPGPSQGIERSRVARGGNNAGLITPQVIDRSAELAGAQGLQVSPSARRNRFLFIDRILFLVAIIMTVCSYILRRRYSLLKRLFDIVGSIVGLSLLLPVVAAAVILVKIDSRGPAFIKQVRVGMNRRRYPGLAELAQERRRVDHLGSLFVIYKLRTMRADAESRTGPVWASENDNRVTRIGRVLRKTHIDEIPQFINVLKGDMGIIGPRPERPIFISALNEHIRGYNRRLRVKPGITGLAQVRYRYASSVVDAKIKFKYDMLYVKRMSFAMDVGILLTTFNTIVTAKGAR